MGAKRNTMEYIRQSELYHLAQMDDIKIDHALVTGLADR